MSWRKKAGRMRTRPGRRPRTRATAQVEARATDARAQYYLGAAQSSAEASSPRRGPRSSRPAPRDSTPILVDYQTGFSYILEEKWQSAVESLDKVNRQGHEIRPRLLLPRLAYGKLNRKDKMLVDMDLFVAYAPHAPEAAIARLYLQH